MRTLLVEELGRVQAFALSVPLALALALAAFFLLFAAPAAADTGSDLYAEHCAGCHGAKGMAETPVGKALKAAHLAELTLTAEDLSKAIETNDKHKPLRGTLSDDDLKAIAAHIATLKAE